MSNLQCDINKLFEPEIKRLIAETVNAIPTELRICDRINPHGVMIKNNEIVFATGKRVDGYTARKFYDALVSTIDCINRQVIEDLIQQLQEDAMYYCSRCMSMTNEWEIMELLPKMYYKYQLIFERTKYRAIRIISTFVRPVNEYYTIPFIIDEKETMAHNFFWMNFEQYKYVINFISMGGSLKAMYEGTKYAARCNEAGKVQKRRKECRNVPANKPSNHFSNDGNRLPPSKGETG